MPERKTKGSVFKLTAEEASAVMALESKTEITPYMRGLIDSVGERAFAIGYSPSQVLALAALTDEVSICLSFDKNFFKNPEDMDFSGSDLSIYKQSKFLG